MWERIKSWIHNPTQDEKLAELKAKSEDLCSRRDSVYDGSSDLEALEAGLLEKGKESTSKVVRRRLAARLASVRKDLSRANASAAMFNKQIDIVHTAIHNMELVSHCETASLDPVEQITENAVKAEEILESLTADADMMSVLACTNVSMSADELAILEEFEDADETTKVVADKKVKIVEEVEIVEGAEDGIGPDVANGNNLDERMEALSTRLETT